VNGLHSERNKNAYISLHESRPKNHAILDEKGSGIIDFNLLENTTRGNTFMWQLSHHL
jgi:hypothetical protein